MIGFDRAVVPPLRSICDAVEYRLGLYLVQHRPQIVVRSFVHIFPVLPQHPDKMASYKAFRTQNSDRTL
jgi:hypothetical protein